MTHHVFAGELARAHVHDLGTAPKPRRRRQRAEADEQPASRPLRPGLSWRGGPTMPGPPVLDDPDEYSVLDDPAVRAIHLLLGGGMGLTGAPRGPMLAVRLLRLLVDWVRDMPDRRAAS